MKTIYFIRHAKSSWNQPVADHDRQINKRGALSAHFIGDLLKERKITPDLMITSTAARAYQTSTIVSTAINYPEENIQQNNQLYLASPETLMHEIWKLENKLDTVIFCGHNPGFSDAIPFFSNDFFEMPTCAVAQLKFDFNDWGAVFEGTADLVWKDCPKNHQPFIDLLAKAGQ